MTEKKITRRVFVTWENDRKFKFQCRSMKLCLHTIAYVELSDCNRYHCGLQNLERSPSGTLQTWADPRQRLEGRWGTLQMLWALARFLSAFVPGWPLFVLGLGSCCTHPSVLFAQGFLVDRDGLRASPVSCVQRALGEELWYVGGPVLHMLAAGWPWRSPASVWSFCLEFLP